MAARIAGSERLSALDASYLAAGQPDHVTGARLLVFSAPPPGFDAVLEQVRDRLPMVPRLQSRVRRGMLELRRPRWQRDPDFDLRRHVRQMPLPPTGRESELEAVSGALLSQPVDLRRPLWELWYFEGLPGGRFAIGAKFHHSLADGATADYLLTQLFPSGRVAVTHLGDEPARAREGRGSDLGGRGAPSVASMKKRFASAHPRRLQRRARRQFRRLALSSAVSPPRRSAPQTPLNRGPVGNARSVRLVSVPLSDLRLAKGALDTTVNSLVVTAVAGAVRGYFVRNGLPPTDLIALVPISLHQPGNPSLGNRVRSVVCPLPASEPDASARLRRVTDSLGASVPAARAAGERPSIIGPQAWRDYIARRRSGERLFNLIVTNSRGSTVPHRCCGRTAELMLASGPNIHFAGPVIRVSSYLDSLTIAVTTDLGQVSDGETLAAELNAALHELLTLPGGSSRAAGYEAEHGWMGAPWIGAPA